MRLISRVATPGALIALLLALAASCSSSDPEGLPDFAHEENGTLTVDLEEATDGRATRPDANEDYVVYRLDGCEIGFATSGFWDPGLSEPNGGPDITDTQVEISDRIDSGDDLAQVSFTPVIDEDSGAIDLHLFFDSQWPDIVSGETAVYESEADTGPFNPPDRNEIRFTDNSFAYHKWTLPDSVDIESCEVSEDLLVSNIPGDYLDTLSSINGISFDAEEIVIWLRVRAVS